MNIDSTEDNQQKRSRIDRRHCSFTLHIPARRTGKERRSGGKNSGYEEQLIKIVPQKPTTQKSLK